MTQVTYVREQNNKIIRDKTIHIAPRDCRIVKVKCGLHKDEVHDYSNHPRSVTCVDCIEKILEKDKNDELETIRLLEWQRRLKELE